MKARGDLCRVGIIASLDIGSDHLLDTLATKGFWGHGSFPCRVGNPINLTATEFNLLRYFMLNPRHVLSKSQILDHVWHYDFGGDGNVVETYVSYLRKKLEKFGPPLIHTIRLVGYTLREPESTNGRG